MTSAIMKFDTLTWARKLENAGIPAQHAEAQVELLSHVIEDSTCTKQNLKESERKIEAKLKELELSLELKIVKAKNQLIKWFIGTFTVSIATTTSIIKVFFL